VIEYDFKVTLSFVLAIVTIVYTWWRTRDSNVDSRFKAVDAKFKDGSERMDRHDTRLNSVEHTLRDLPTKDDMHKLHLSVERMSGKIDTMVATNEGTNKVIGRLEAAVDRQDSYLHEVKR
jgi:hypothetical protein